MFDDRTFSQYAIACRVDDAVDEHSVNRTDNEAKGALHISTHPADYDLAVEDQTANA